MLFFLVLNNYPDFAPTKSALNANENLQFYR